MPWDAKSFASKHNKKLAKSPAVAKSAAKQANAMLKSGASEGVAIATANSRANAKQRSARTKPGLINSQA